MCFDMLPMVYTYVWMSQACSSKLPLGSNWYFGAVIGDII